ncbi:MAG TPA: sensor domain-containing diguanylate cyclase [Kofleriaceae bacterium]|nr:sensor domain-containing diguanylate cyclase [Kofleriaceae bacterium]
MRPDQLARLPQTLFEIGKAFGSDDFVPDDVPLVRRNLAALLVRLSDLVCEQVGADACSIMLLDHDGQRLLGKAASGLARDDLAGMSFRLGEGVAGWVAERGEPALIEDVALDRRYVAQPESERRIRSLACVPISYRDAHIGVMTVTSTGAGAFTLDDVEVLGFIATTIALDIDNARLRRLAMTDPLTEAYNREFLHEHLPRAMEAAEGRGEPLSVALIDVDHFKEVNDQLGHDVGDRVLADVARRLRAGIRAADLLVRYGGEEFLAILPGTGAELAREIAERVRAKLEDDPIVVGARSIEVRVSIGVAERRPGTDSSLELIRRADQALYAAKRGGRNRVEVAP